MQDAVEGLESPWVQSIGNGCHLQGTFAILQAEDARGAAVMIGAGFHGGVDDPAAWAVWVVILNRRKPQIRLPAIRRQMGEDKPGRCGKISSFSRTSTHTPNTQHAPRHSLSLQRCNGSDSSMRGLTRSKIGF